MRRGRDRGGRGGQRPPIETDQDLAGVVAQLLQ